MTTIAAALICWFLVPRWGAVFELRFVGQLTKRAATFALVAPVVATALAIYFWVLALTSGKAWAEKVAREADDPRAPSKREWWTI
ncbi:hypothetical protein ACL9RL_08395 [Plantibacter sp. Mn2098]|uniref:hypothetical protein n=1 Tax=Plantibacter sp. Mn2098 TaxID=3395266 RepID=UPI003BE7DFB9